MDDEVQRRAVAAGEVPSFWPPIGVPCVALTGCTAGWLWPV